MMVLHISQEARCMGFSTGFGVLGCTKGLAPLIVEEPEGLGTSSKLSMAEVNGRPAHRPVTSASTLR